MRHALAPAVSFAMIACLSACAAPGGPPRGPGGAGFGPGGPGGGPALFISPFGQPYVGEPGQPWPVADWFTDADQDLDGTITFAEFEANGRAWFIRLDSNGDGEIGPGELAAYEDLLRTLRPAAGGPPEGRDGERGAGPPPSGGSAGGRRNLGDSVQDRGPPGGGRGAGPQGRRGGRPGQRGYGTVADAGFFNLPQPVKAADANVDQRVSREEWAQATERRFLALDADGDGRLTLDTLPRTPLQQRAEPQQPPRR